MERSEPQAPLAGATGDAAVLAAPESPSARLVRLFLDRRKKTTLAAYAADLTCFQQFVGAETAVRAIEQLLGCGHGGANALVLEYRGALEKQLARGTAEKPLSAATVNRRLAAVRSLVRLARLIGLVDWQLDVENVPASGYRDTRGPSREMIQSMLAATAERADNKGLRDRAMLRLLHDLGLRRQEVVSLSVSDLDLEARTVTVIAKGQTEPQKLTLPDVTAVALSKWLDARGSEPGPLFTNFDRAKKASSRRLSGDGLYRVVRTLGARAASCRVRPHGLRHAAITTALDLTNGDLRRSQKFSRHRDPRTLLCYDDNRRDLGGEVAGLVAASLG